MKPVVCIATHDRIAITRKNIDSLLRDDERTQIVLAVSTARDHAAFRNIDRVHLVMVANNPLGAKWQATVMKARLLGADVVMITGSDDILGKGAAQHAINVVESGFDFTGCMRWHVLDEKTGTVYCLKYNASIPLGGGRVYSKKFLDKINWKVFDTSRNKWLDDLGFHQVERHAQRFEKDSGLNILSIKGQWKVMNPIDKMLKHKNITVLEKYDSLDAIKHLYPL